MKFWRRKQEERELDEELRFHLAQEEQLRLDRGQDPAVAHRDFGNLTLVRENTRETWGWAALERTARDARFALRLLRKSPAFALTAIGVLALGIGATTAIYSVVNAVLLRPLLFPEPDRLVMVWESRIPGKNNVIQTQNFLDWRARNQSFSRIAAVFGVSMNLSGQGEAVQSPGMRVSYGFFDILGVPPLLGRTFTDADEELGAPAVAILSYGLWHRRFGGSADVLGRKIMLDGTPNEVIGIMPPDFAFPTIRADVYSPMHFNPAIAPRDGRNYQAVARLKPGVTVQQAQHEMEAIAAQIARERPKMNTGWTARVIPLMEQTVGNSRQCQQSAADARRRPPPRNDRARGARCGPVASAAPDRGGKPAAGVRRRSARLSAGALGRARGRPHAARGLPAAAPRRNRGGWQCARILHCRLRAVRSRVRHLPGASGQSRASCGRAQAGRPRRIGYRPRIA